MTKELSQEKIGRVAEGVHDWAQPLLDPHAATDYSAGFNKGFHRGVEHLRAMLEIEAQR